MRKSNAPQGAKNNRNHSTVIQRSKLLTALRESGSQGLTTIQCREQLDIMMPGSRVYELRHNYGYNILLIWDKAKNAQGNEHFCGRYILFPGKWGVTA